MSDLLRSMPKNHQQQQQHNDTFPPEAPRPPPNPHVPSSSASSTSSSSSSSSTSTTASISTLRPASPSSPSPLPPNPWPQFFDQELYLSSHTPTQSASYHVYLTAPANPQKGPLFICHHGAGASGMSFALFARQVRVRMPEAGVLSLEARGHGSSVLRRRAGAEGAAETDADASAEAEAEADAETDADFDFDFDFSISTLVADALAMISRVVTQQRWPSLPPSILIGHSLGGAVATHIAASGALGAQLVGFCVLDVVEGSAMEALRHMETYLSSRPAVFASVEEAVEWHVRSRTVRNVESARASVPGLLVRKGDGEGWGWRTELLGTREWWEGWFSGLSGLFLRGRAAKALLLAGTDRLDRELMIGQMQGRFQLTVIPEAGHFIQEDVPDKTAQLMIEFFKRNDRSAMVLPPKVSDLIAQGKKV